MTSRVWWATHTAQARPSKFVPLGQADPTAWHLAMSVHCSVCLAEPYAPCFSDLVGYHETRALAATRCEAS